MKKTILTDVVGWTPVIDSVAIDVGITGAVIFGKIWRFCQMADGECWASQERIASELGISRHTVLDAIKALITKGYIEEVESTQRRTNTYRDTGKAGIKISLTAGNDLCKNLTGTCEESEQLPVQKVNTKIVLRNNQESNDFQTSSGEPERKPRTAEDIKAMTRQALINHAERVKSGVKETEHFPADVVGVIGRVCELWQLMPPASKDNRFAYWIKSARELKDACAEFGVGLIDRVHREWLDSQYTVSSPASLINMAAAAAAGERREKTVSVAGDTTDKSYYWNSALSEEENLRLMRNQKETNHDPDSEGLS